MEGEGEGGAAGRRRVGWRPQRKEWASSTSMEAASTPVARPTTRPRAPDAQGAGAGLRGICLTPPPMF